MAAGRRKVAVLGGGVGAMAAAFALTSFPGAAQAYEVHVYQMGWRLGGKGASGRRKGQAQRIEEHGLHVWSGFYDNAIRMMKDCLAAVSGEPGVYHSFDEAFIPHNNIVLGEEVGGEWKRWALRPQMNEAVPGEGGVALSPWDYFRMLVGFVRGLVDERAPEGFRIAQHPRDVLPPRLADHVAERIGMGIALQGSMSLHWLHALSDVLPRDTEAHDRKDQAALTLLTRQIQRDLSDSRQDLIARDALSDELRRAHVMVDLGAASLRGMLADELFLKGFEAIDGEEISAWLARHGAQPESIDSALVRAVYDYAFGYRRGSTAPANRAIAAGTFLRGTLRLFLTYKGAIFFKMRAGMGDTIFTPFYKALRKRGVRFHFFHKVADLQLDKAGTAVERIVIDRQATVAKGEYHPFVRVKGLDCWPAEPLWDQLVEGADLEARKINLESSWTDWKPVETLTLERGRDFDEVILGISLGALPDIARDLIATDPAWARMVERVETTATQAMQLWLRPRTRELGWPDGDSILTAYADDLNTWADMSHLDATEDWPADRLPGSIAYWCGPLPDPDVIPPYSQPGYPARAEGAVRDAALAWMKTHGTFLFPSAFSRGGAFDERFLMSLAEPAKRSRWPTQFFRANVEPAERYVLSVPGSTSARLRADRSGFANLWLAGDWTYTGLNAGCVEAAVMSGMRAASGLAGIGVPIVGEEADPRPGGGGPGVPGQGPTAPVLQTIRAQNSPWPWSSVYGMAQTTGPSLVLPMPRAVVQAMLPSGLELAPQTLTGPGQHPVILLFALQRDVRPNRLPFGLRYFEFICAVPWVRHADLSLEALPPLICPTKLYLDSMAPILLGIYGYGFPKELAAITADDSSYVVRDLRTGAEIVACAFRPAGPQMRAFDLPHFSAARPGYEMAMVTRNRLGQWQYSVYDFSLGQALLQPIEIEVRIASDRFGLPIGVHRPGSIADSPFGGFFLTADATINNPFQSRSLLRTLRRMAP
ncbi:MAG TPA: NAD(P)-binding protein [Paracoccaceae bacterium]|nr:NAD(P)-binding protein [Paracoccaceae bacterium]